MSEATDKIYELADKLEELRKEKKETEEHVKDINAEIKNIEEHELSSLMDEEGISRVTLNDLNISKSLVFRGGYTSHTHKEAFQFLFDTHNEGALKQELIVDLSACPQAAYVLQSEDIPYQVRYSIHHMTLSSILKELVESGKFSTDDIDKYSVYVQPQVKVKRET